MSQNAEPAGRLGFDSRKGEIILWPPCPNQLWDQTIPLLDWSWPLTYFGGEV